MTRGFTLAELMLAIFIMGVVLLASVPNVQRLHHSHLMRSLATELKSLFSRARAEALYGRETMHIHYQFYPEGSLTRWKLILAKGEASAGESPETYGEIITTLSRHHTFISPSWESIRFDWRSGKVVENGHLDFYIPGKRHNALRLITHNVTGRVRICATGKVNLGYPEC